MVSIVQVLVLSQIAAGTAHSHPARPPSFSGHSCRLCACGRQRVRSLLPESTGSLTYRTRGRYNHLQSYYLITLIAGHLWANLVCALANMITPAPSYLAAQQGALSGPYPILVIFHMLRMQRNLLFRSYWTTFARHGKMPKKVTFALFSVW